MEHVAEVGLDPRIPRCQHKRIAVAACRCLEAPKSEEQRTVIVERICTPAALEEPVVVGDRLACTTEGGERARELRDSSRVVRLELQRSPQGIARCLKLAGLDERIAEIAVPLGQSGLERNDPAVTIDRAREVTSCTLGVREVAESRGEMRPDLKSAPAAGDGGVDAAEREEHAAEVIVRIGEAWRESRGSRKALGRAFEQALLLERLAEEMVRLGIVRQHAARRLEGRERILALRVSGEPETDECRTVHRSAREQSLALGFGLLYAT